MHSCLHSDDAGQIAEKVVAHNALVLHQARHRRPKRCGALVAVAFLDFVHIVDEQQIGPAEQTAQPNDVAVLVVQLTRHARQIGDLVLANVREKAAGGRAKWVDR